MNTAGSTTGWVNHANEPSQKAYDVILLTHSKAGVWTVNNVARLIEFFKKKFYLYIYFYLR